jgi:hypothetical protein
VEVAEALGVADASSSVATIDQERLKLIAQTILRSNGNGFQCSHWDDRLFWNVEARADTRSQYFAVGNAINFRFWELRGHTVVASEGIIGGVRFRGALYMWRCLRRALDQGHLPILDAAFLAGLTDAHFDEIFADDEGANPLHPGREERIANLRDLGRRLLADWEGAFYHLAEASGGSIVRFASLSRSLRAFDDPLYKLIMVNAILHSGSGVYVFRDELLPGIDYQLLKQLLRQGVLEPSDGVRGKLQESRLLSPIEAHELRHQALLAMVNLSRITGLSGEVLDNYYWLNRTICKDPVPTCVEPDSAERCPFLGACSQLIDIGRPLELTRYY